MAAGDAPPIEAPLSQVDALWTRDAVVFWPEPRAVRRAETHERRGRARPCPALGYSEPELPAAVTRFQQETDLVADGLLGSRTRMALFARSGTDRPRLGASGARP